MKDIELLRVDGRKHKAVVIRPQHRRLFIELQKPEHKGQISKAMAAVGYPVTMQNVPKNVTETKSWRALMEEYMPQDLLAKRHMELLNKRDGEFITVGHGENRRVEFVERGVDTTAVSRGLEMAYKLRGSFVSEAPVATNPVNVYNLFYKPEVRAQVSAFESQLKQAITHEISTSTQEPNRIEAGADASTGDNAGASTSSSE